MTATGAPPPSGPTLRIVSVNDVYVLDDLPRLRNLVRHHAVTAPADAFIVAIAGDFLAPSTLSSLDAEPPSDITANLLLHTLDADHDQRISRREAEAMNEPAEPAPGSAGRSK
jgi:5'-nucleotidase